jgi:hypothetical protein
VAARERDVEPSEESVHVYTQTHELSRFQQGQSIGSLPLTVISRRLELKGDLERQVLLLDGPDVDVLDSARVADDGSELDAVDERFSESNVPDCSPRRVSPAAMAWEGKWQGMIADAQLIFSSLYSWSSIAARKMVALSGKRRPSGAWSSCQTLFTSLSFQRTHEVLIPGEEDGVKHRLVEEEVAHPLRHVSVTPRVEVLTAPGKPTSEIMMSTFFSGSSTSSSLPFTRTISAACQLAPPLHLRRGPLGAGDRAEHIRSAR